MQEPGFNLWFGKIPWRRKWQLTQYIPWTEKPGEAIVHGIAKRVTRDLVTKQQITCPIPLECM